MNDFDFNINPVKTYNQPNIPTFKDNNPTLLKKLPKRWQHNAKVIACMGVIGAFTLSGCGTTDLSDIDIVQTLRRTQISSRPNNIVHDLGYAQGAYSGYREDELLFRLHTGGGGASFYVVHLTEQEAFGIIRARLEAAGLEFGATPPNHTIEWGTHEVSLDLFDSQKNVAIAHLSWLGASRGFMPSEHMLAAYLEEQFAEQVNDTTIGVFYNPGRGLGGNILRENIEDARPLLRRQLTNQADIFIASLQSMEILERFPKVNVIINDAPIDFGEYSIIINNHKMVPALEIFELLGMNVSLESSHSRLVDFQPIVARKDGIIIRIQRDFFEGTYHIGVNNEWLDSDIPVIMRDDIILVPLQLVADIVGASIEWDGNIQTFKITTTP